MVQISRSTCTVLYNNYMYMYMYCIYRYLEWSAF